MPSYYIIWGLINNYQNKKPTWIPISSSFPRNMSDQLSLGTGRVRVSMPMTAQCWEFPTPPKSNTLLKVGSIRRYVGQN